MHTQQDKQCRSKANLSPITVRLKEGGGSRHLYPAFKAAATASFVVCSSALKVPRPSRGIRRPVFKRAVG